MTAINRFDEIEHTPLRAYNRVVVCHNLREDSGDEAVLDYLNTFTNDERKQMLIINTMLQQFGVKKTKEIVTKDLEFGYNVGEEEEIDIIEAS